MAFVVAIEGIAKSGKTTQCGLVKASLRKQSKRTTVVPEFVSSAIGELAENLALDRVKISPHVAFLVSAANAWG